MLKNKHERFLKELYDKDKLKEYKEKYDNIKISKISKFFALILFGTVELIYGKEPSVRKFRVIEVVARVPYQTWEFVSYLWTTNFYMYEDRAIKYAKIGNEGRFAQDNETMHVVVISQIYKQRCKKNFFLYTFLPIILAYIYWFISTILFMFSPRFSYHLNYLFEDHAYNQYKKFISKHKTQLKKRQIDSKFLKFYGRNCENEYDFFKSVMIDEIIHRNNSIEMLESFLEKH